MIKGIIFDFEGPLMTNEKWLVWRKYDEIKRLEKGSIKHLIRQYWEGAHVGKYDNVFDFYEKAKLKGDVTAFELDKILNEIYSTQKLNFEMVDFIKSIKDRYTISLFSNFTADLNKFLIDKFNIYNLFDVVINSYDIKLKKPYPEAFNYVLDKMKLKFDEVVFVDDQEKNIEGSKNIGIKTILYKDMEQFKKEFSLINSL